MSCILDLYGRLCKCIQLDTLTGLDLNKLLVTLLTGQLMNWSTQSLVKLYMCQLVRLLIGKFNGHIVGSKS